MTSQYDGYQSKKVENVGTETLDNYLKMIYGDNYQQNEDYAKLAWQVKNFMSGIPVIGSYFTMSDQTKYMQDYLDNRGLSWTDIKYPTLTGNTSGYSSLGRSMTNFVSSNIKNLYKDYQKVPKRRGFKVRR